MGFIDNLRMGNIYGGGIPGVKPIKNMVSGDPMQEILNKYMAMRSSFGEQQPQLENIGAMQGQPKMDVVFKDTMTPYQRETLALRDRGLDINENKATNTLAFQREKTAQTNAMGQDRIAIQRAGQELREWKAQNPNMQIKATKGGNYVAINPQTGESFDTGVPTGTLDKETELEIMQTNALERIDTQGDIRSRHIREGGEQSRITKTTAPGRNNSGELPTQTKVRLANRANQLVNQMPWIADNGHISFTSDGQFTLKQGKLSDAQYQELYNMFYQDEPESAPNTPAAPTNVAPVAPTAPKGWKYVPKPGGGWTAVEVK